MVFEFIKKVLLETFQFFLYLLVGASEVIGTYITVLIHFEKPILCSGSVCGGELLLHLLLLGS